MRNNGFRFGCLNTEWNRIIKASDGCKNFGSNLREFGSLILEIEGVTHFFI
jgi:hypothetical protein